MRPPRWVSFWRVWNSTSQLLHRLEGSDAIVITNPMGISVAQKVCSILICPRVAMGCFPVAQPRFQFWFEVQIERHPFLVTKEFSIFEF